MTTATTTPSPVVTPAAPAAQPAKAAKPTKPETAPKAPKASKAAKPAKKAVAEKAPASKPATATKAASAVKPTKATEPKGKKPKLVRDSFTIPKDEYAVLDTLKDRGPPRQEKRAVARRAQGAGRSVRQRVAQRFASGAFHQDRSPKGRHS